MNAVVLKTHFLTESLLSLILSFNSGHMYCIMYNTTVCTHLVLELCKTINPQCSYKATADPANKDQLYL